MSSPFQSLSPGLRLVLAYYLATPIFWLLEVVFDWQFRVAFWAEPKWNAIYYSVLVILAVVAYVRPTWLALIALVESGGNIALHILSFAVPLFTLSDSVLQGRSATPDLSIGHVIGFLLAGLCMSLSFQTAVARLHTPGK